MRISRQITTLIPTALVSLIATAVVGQTVRPSTMVSQLANSDSTASRMSNGITKDQADEILRELKAIHEILEHQQTPTQPKVAPTSNYVQLAVPAQWYALGREDAPVTVVEFTDYQCPFCRKFHSDTFTELKKSYIDTGKVRFVSRDLPLDLHSNALAAAMAARCAGEQNKFWEMRDMLLAMDADLSPGALTKYGDQINLNMRSFEACVNEKKYDAAIQKDVADAGALGIAGTPSFVVGKAENGRINGIRIVGTVPSSVFQASINNQLTSSPIGAVAERSTRPATTKP